MQIVVLDGFCVNPGDVDWGPLKRLGTISVYDRTHPDMVAQRVRGADAVFVNKCARLALFNIKFETIYPKGIFVL